MLIFIFQKPALYFNITIIRQLFTFTPYIDVFILHHCTLSQHQNREISRTTDVTVARNAFTFILWCCFYFYLVKEVQSVRILLQNVSKKLHVLLSLPYCGFRGTQVKYLYFYWSTCVLLQSLGRIYGPFWLKLPKYTCLYIPASSALNASIVTSITDQSVRVALGAAPDGRV